MCRVGLIDDVKDEYEDYRYRLELRNIELLFMDYEKTFDEILNWILNNRIEVLLIDYKLDLLYDFSGSKLFQFINNKIPDLQCILFTSNPDDDDLVIKALRVNKDVFNSDDKFNNFVDMLKQASTVFNNRQQETINEYKILLNKKEKGTITPIEQKKFIDLYNRLESYGFVEKLPERLLESDFENAIDNLIKEVEEYVSNNEKNTQG